LAGDKGELAEECADVSLVLKDLCHVAHVDLPGEEIAKWGRFHKEAVPGWPERNHLRG
jgi:NTP pyrophosphatase (non-canonical NTP hydrolase)